MTAVRVGCNVEFRDVAAGNFRFGMHVHNSSRKETIYYVNASHFESLCSVYGP